jgi:hypothetical protein
MTTLQDSRTAFPLRAAVEARDHRAAVEAFAADAVVRSPITGRRPFTGRDQIAALLGVILDVFEDIRYVDELGSGDSHVLVFRARVDGEEIEGVDHIRLDRDGKIREMTVFFRPMPAIAVAARVIGSGLGRRRSRMRAAVISTLSRPLAVMIRLGDRVGVRLVWPTLGPTA